MSNSVSKIDQALSDLVEAFSELEAEFSEKYADDEEALEHALAEVLETSIDSALEEHDCTPGFFATLINILSEGLEQLDPSAFGEEDDEFGFQSREPAAGGIEYEDEEIMDLDEDEDEDDEDEDEDEDEDDEDEDEEDEDEDDED